MSELMWSRISLYQVRIAGVSHGTREEADPLVDWIRAGRLAPVLLAPVLLAPVLHATFRLSELHRAEDHFVHRGSDFLGKIAIVPDAEWAEHGAPHAVVPTGG